METKGLIVEKTFGYSAGGGYIKNFCQTNRFFVFCSDMLYDLHSKNATKQQNQSQPNIRQVKTLNPCIIIPAYNAAKTIGKVVRESRQYVSAVVVVDDGCTDQTTFLSEEAGAIALKHNRNKGKGAALKTAFDYVLGTHWDVFIIMDADGQHDPDDIPAFLEAHMSDHNCVFVGNRMTNPKGMPFVRKITNKVMSFIISFLIKQKVPDSQCGYKLFPKKIIAGMNLEATRYDIETELLFRASCADARIGSVPVRTIYADEVSTIRPVPDTVRFIKIIVSFWKMRKKGLSKKDLARKQAFALDARKQQESRTAETPVEPERQSDPSIQTAAQTPPPVEYGAPETKVIRKKKKQKTPPQEMKPFGEDELPLV